MKNFKGSEILKRLLQIALGASGVLISAHYLSKAGEKKALSDRLERLEVLVDELRGLYGKRTKSKEVDSYDPSCNGRT